MKHALLALSMSVLLLVSATADAASPRHLRVIWLDDPSSEAVVSWTTEGPAETRLVWDTEERASASAYANSVYPARSGSFDEDEPETYHHAVLDSLPPASRVHFRVLTEGEESADFWFWTAPDDARPFVLLYGGDSRSDRRTRREMNERMRDLVESDPSIIALVHGGDYVYRGSSWELWDQWLDDWQRSITSDNRVLPIVPARGNHEGDATLYNEVFAFPGAREAYGDWFATRIGEDFLLLNLDSNVSQAGAQRQWLADQLERGQKFRWIATNYHRPAYPAVKSPGGALYHWVPLFEQFNVDVVLESDGHVLKRTVPIRDGQHDPSGVVYVGEGGLGVPQREPDLDRWYLAPPGMARAAHHIQALRVTPDAIYYAAILKDGTVADSYTFKPRRRGQYEEPSVESLRLLSANEIEVVFARAVARESAENRANYHFEPPAAISTIRYAPERQVALLKTSMPPHAGHRITVDGVVDIAGKAVARTVFSVPETPTDDFPIPAKLEVAVPPTATEQIAVRPIGEPPPQRSVPPMFACAASPGSSGLGPLPVLVLVGAMVRRRPKEIQR